MAEATAEIPLTRGLVAVVDTADLDFLLSQGSWQARTESHTSYAVRVFKVDGVRRLIPMHGLLLGIRGVDHVNGDGLDNRRVNLRPATAQQQSRNQRRRSDNTTGYKGVVWVPSRSRWRARFTVDGKLRYLGTFTDPVEAAKAYDAAVREAFGEFARLNFPGGAVTTSGPVVIPG